MKKNAKLAPPPTSLRQVAVFLHNADFLRLRVTKPPPDSPTERGCFALGTGNDLERSKFLINGGEIWGYGQVAKVIESPRHTARIYASSINSVHREACY